MPFFSKLFPRTTPPPDQGDTSSASADVSSDLIALDLSGNHTEAAALEHEPLHHFSHRLMPDQSDLTSLDLGADPDPSAKE